MNYSNNVRKFKVKVLPRLPDVNVILNVVKRNGEANLKIISNNIDDNARHATIVCRHNSVP